MTKYKYDIFLSHASEDKDEFVRPLHKLLTESNINVFYDEESLKFGDKLTNELQIALVESRIILIVISNKFFEKKWTVWEKYISEFLEVEGKTKIIPYFLNIDDMKSLYKKCPNLMNTLGLSSKKHDVSMTAKLLIEHIHEN